MSTFFQNYKNILRISPNENGDDATPLLKSDGVQLSDSQGNMLPVHFSKSDIFTAPNGNEIVIIKTKTDCNITVSSKIITRNTLSVKSLQVGQLKYPVQQPEANQVLGLSAGEQDISWIDISSKFDEVLKEISDTTSVTNGIPKDILLYNAMPYKRYKFHKLRQEITDEEIISGKITKVDADSKLYKSHHLICKDYHLCDGNNETPNLMRDEPTFIRGLNYTIKDNEITADEPDFVVGYCIQNLSDKKDIYGNPCEFYAKKITESKLYSHTVNYLHSKEVRHRHLLFSDKSAETTYFDKENQSNICIFKTGFDNGNGLTVPSGYEPIFKDSYSETWYNYCKCNENFFKGIQPIPTAALVKTYTDEATKIRENEIESAHPIARTGFIPFSHEHYFKTLKETKVKNFVGKYILYGITNNDTNDSLLYNDNYIWRTMTSLPLLHPEKLGEGVTNIMKQELPHATPHPSFINLLPLLKK